MTENHNPLAQYLPPAANQRKSKEAVRTIMLDVHLPDGTRRAMPYSLLTHVLMDGGRLEAVFVPGKVVVDGANLEPLYKGLTQHRVRSVAVTGDLRGFGPEQAFGAPTEPVIRDVSIEEPDSQEGASRMRHPRR